DQTTREITRRGRHTPPKGRFSELTPYDWTPCPTFGGQFISAALFHAPRPPYAPTCLRCPASACEPTRHRPRNRRHFCSLSGLSALFRAARMPELLCYNRLKTQIRASEPNPCTVNPD